MIEVVVTTGAISRAKFQSNHHHQQTNTQFFQARCPSCRQTNSVSALKGIKSPMKNVLSIPASLGPHERLLHCNQKRWMLEPVSTEIDH